MLNIKQTIAKEDKVRILVKLEADGEKMPILYRHRFMDFIIKALESANPDYKQKLYPQDNTKITKPFSFSVVLPPFEISKEKFKIDKDFEVEDIVFNFKHDKTIKLYLSSSSYEFVLSSYNGFLNIDNFKFNDNLSLKVKKVIPLNEKDIKEKEVIFKTMSPILIEDEKENPLLPSHSSFNKHFNEIHDRIIKDIRGYGLKEEIKFTEVKVKKQVVKHTLKDFRDYTHKPYFTFTTFEGIFKLEGHPDDLKLLYQVGIGLRTGQGFGMVEVIK